MQSIKSQSKLENIVTKELWRKGYRFRKNVKDLIGRPDIAIKKYKIVIFIDSCFWHSCEIHGNIPKSNTEFWANKLHENKKRDNKVNKYYSDKGWHLLRVWEHDIKKNMGSTINHIISFIERAKKCENK